MSEMISYAESLRFAKEELHIENSEDLLQKDRYEILRQITIRLQVHSPFHNLFLLAQDSDKRRKPSWEEIKSRMLTRTGGLCYPKNLFTFYLLQALGFNVILVIADLLSQPQRQTKHIVLNVQDVIRPGDRYMVDVGMLWPTWEPVDLSFEKESSVFIQSHFRIKYIKEGENIIRLQHKDEGNIHNYSRVSEMRPEAWDPSQVGEYIDKIYKIPAERGKLLHNRLTCVQYNANGNFRLLLDNVFKRDMDDGNIVKRSIDGDDALIECILENFPKLSKDLVMKAVVNWRKVCSK